MKMNMGTVDRTIHVLIALGIAVLYFTGRISGTLEIILGVLALVLLATRFIGWCPRYLPLGLSTGKEPPVSGSA